VNRKKIHPFHDTFQTKKPNENSQDNQKQLTPEKLIPFAYLADALCMKNYEYDILKPLKNRIDSSMRTV